MGTELGITPVIIRGEELKQKGFGGTFAGDIYRRLNDLYLMLALCLSLSVCHYFSLSQLNTDHLQLFFILSGIYGVGKAAEHPPALAVLSHKPDGATQTIAWVGKGIVYDTGGLSIKGKVYPTFTCTAQHRKRNIFWIIWKYFIDWTFGFNRVRGLSCTSATGEAEIDPLKSLFIFFFLNLQTTMPGMKRDCGGAAAILGAFRATVKQVL